MWNRITVTTKAPIEIFKVLWTQHSTRINLNEGFTGVGHEGNRGSLSKFPVKDLNSKTNEDA